jgi:hypothetical protein
VLDDLAAESDVKPDRGLFTSVSPTPANFRALRLAQSDIDLRPERYTQDYKEKFPVRFRNQMDARR